MHNMLPPVLRSIGPVCLKSAFLLSTVSDKRIRSGRGIDRQSLRRPGFLLLWSHTLMRVPTSCDPLSLGMCKECYAPPASFEGIAKQRQKINDRDSLIPFLGVAISSCYLKRYKPKFRQGLDYLLANALLLATFDYTSA